MDELTKRCNQIKELYERICKEITHEEVQDMPEKMIAEKWHEKTREESECLDLFLAKAINHLDVSAQPKTTGGSESEGTKGSKTVYDFPQAFEAFIHEGGNVGLYEEASG